MIKECISKLSPEKSTHLIYNLMDSIKTLDECKYQEFVDLLYEEAYGHHLNQEMALDWIDKLDLESTISKEGTDLLAKERGIDFSKVHFNEWEWFALVNMKLKMLQKYTEDLNEYANCAEEFLRSGEDVAYNYYKYFIKKS